MDEIFQYIESLFDDVIYVYKLCSRGQLFLACIPFGILLFILLAMFFRGYIKSSYEQIN